MGIFVNRMFRIFGAALLAVGLLLTCAAAATASAPDFVLRMPQGDELPAPDAGAAETTNPRGVAGNPDTGHVYVADFGNNRINEYTAWGAFVKSWGWDVAPDGAPGDTATDEAEICGPVGPEVEPPAGLCKGGAPGPGRGQFSSPQGLAIDVSGNIYVYDAGNRRVQKFSSSGEFLLMFGGDVNQTEVGKGAGPDLRNVCTAASGDICQAGTSGEGPSQLDSTLGDFIAYSPTDGGRILVGDKGGIQVFDLNGKYIKTIAFEGPLGAFAGKQVNGLDVDEEGNIYISVSATEDVYKLGPAGEPLSPGNPGASSFKAEEPLGVAVDVQGNIYAIDDPDGLAGRLPRVVKYTTGGTRLIPTEAEEQAGDLFPDRTQGARLTAIATNFCEGSEEPGNLYVGFFNAGGGTAVSYVDAYGTGPVGCELPPLTAPVIGEQFALQVGREEATLRALINPKFWPDGTYYVEYGTKRCTAGGCPSQVPLSPALLTSRAVNAFISTAGVILEGLAPGTTYYYRFVAKSSGGGPVHGIDPDATGSLKPDPTHGLEASFTTHAPKAPVVDCPNEGFRIGPASDLPDCRAYEMVSPLDKGNADVALGQGRNAVPYRFFEVNKSALSASHFTFTAATALADAQSAPFASQYVAGRGPGGWESKAISPPRTESGVETTINFAPEFQGFTEDLCRAWLRLYSVAPLTEDAIAKYPNLYRRENCIEPSRYTALTTEKPSKTAAEEYTQLLIQGFSDDGSHAIFTAPGQLPGTAAPVPGAGETLLYEKTGDGLRFVCLLPSDNPVPDACAAGAPAKSGPLDLSSLDHAISADGSHIFWTAYSADGADEIKPGRIYVRIDGKETLPVSVPVSPEPAFFWTAAEDGSKAIFQYASGPRKGQLYEFDVDANKAQLVAAGVESPMGASDDASRLYFASTEDLDGSGPAVVGGRNLYFSEADPSGGAHRTTFIMALAASDVGLPDSGVSVPAMRPVDLLPSMRLARITPDGLHATFMSAATPTPTGYDNRDAESGKAAPEVYRYDAAARRLLCVSCNSTGARPIAGTTHDGLFAAARIQGWEANHHAPRVISDDGSRVFFESHEALVPEDSNGTWDVYQWEEPGAGTCTTSRDTFSTMTGGCVDLISSGQSPSRSLFLDADPSGDNIFFGTQSSLVGADYGLNDVYVARVGGGFPEPVPPSECEGEACQSPPPPPPVRTPASEAFRGPGDKAKRRCPKAKRRVKRKGKVRCVKKRSHKRRKAAQRKGARR